MKKALKILAVALLLAATVVPAQAQRRVIHYLPKYENEPYHFGFLLAYNQMMYTIKTVEDYQNKEIIYDSSLDKLVPFGLSNAQSLTIYNIETKQTPGFTVGIVGSKRLGRYFDLRFIPSLSFSDRQLKYDIAIWSQNGGDPDMKHLDKAIFTTFVEFPLNIKYRSKRYNNIGAYLFGGINPKLDLATQKQNLITYTNSQGEEVDLITNFVTKRFDFAAEIGAGFDIYNQWFKLGIEVKMSYGMLDIVKSEVPIYTTAIDQLHNKMFQLSFLFE